MRTSPRDDQAPDEASSAESPDEARATLHAVVDQRTDADVAALWRVVRAWVAPAPHRLYPEKEPPMDPARARR